MLYVDDILISILQELYMYVKFTTLISETILFLKNYILYNI